jgi:hypothetical protein
MNTKNQRGKAELWINLMIGVMGLVAGLFPGYGPIIIDAIVNRELPKISGKWTGEFKEWCPANECSPGKWITSTERMELSQSGSRLSATVQLQSDGKPHEWEAAGRYRTSVLALSYIEKTPDFASVGAYVLERDKEAENFLGYWTGFDRHLNKLVTCPYVLVPDWVDRRKIESNTDLAAWLQKECNSAQS